MVAQRELDERLRAIEAKLLVEERDWRDEERKLFELEETYLRETTVHGNVFTGWGDAKTAPIRFRNAARRRKKRERQDPLAQPTLSVEEQLKVDKHRVASYSSMTSPAESIRATIAARAAKAAEKAAAAASVSAANAAATVAASPMKAASSKTRVASPSGKPSPAKKARKQNHRASRLFTAGHKDFIYPTRTMGSSASMPSPLAPTFERMASWDMKAAKRLLSEYKEKDLDFGLDAQALAEICGGDHAYADAIIDAFGGTNGIVNALAYICGAILVSSGAALEKAGLVFDALDFDMTEQITMDEMTIVFLCCARGYCVMAGTGVVPTDEAFEHVTLQAYRELSKSSGHSVTKNEFTKWVLHFISMAPPHGEVSLDDMAVQFGLVTAPATKSLPEQVLSELADENNGFAGRESGGDMEETPPQEEKTPVAEGEMPLSDELKVVETPAEQEHLQKEEEQEQVRDAEAADAAVAAGDSAVDVNRDQGDLESSAVADEYADEFQAETPLDDGDYSERPPSPPFQEGEADCVSAPEMEFTSADPMEDQHAPPKKEEAETVPVSGEVDNTKTPDDFNTFETYDYADAAFDSSSGLSPPDLLDAEEQPPVESTSAEPTPHAANEDMGSTDDSG